MKVMAMVDGVEREVVLTRKQWCNAFTTIQKYLDSEDFEYFMDEWFDSYFLEEDREMVRNAKYQIISDYRNNMDEGDWWKTMDETIAEYIHERKQ